MFFSKALFWASTDSKPVIFKTSQGAWMLFRGESLLLRIYNSPAQDLHILFLFIYLFKGGEGKKENPLLFPFFIAVSI